MVLGCEFRIENLTREFRVNFRVNFAWISSEFWMSFLKIFKITPYWIIVEILNGAKNSHEIHTKSAPTFTPAQNEKFTQNSHPHFHPRNPSSNSHAIRTKPYTKSEPRIRNPLAQTIWHRAEIPQLDLGVSASKCKSEPRDFKWSARNRQNARFRQHCRSSDWTIPAESRFWNWADVSARGATRKDLWILGGDGNFQKRFKAMVLGGPKSKTGSPKVETGSPKA